MGLSVEFVCKSWVESRVEISQCPTNGAEKLDQLAKI